jgi:serine phosphatase RsbU (regulator of sigma subunit)
MEQAVRRFARNVLLIHLAALAVVLVIVYFASRAIERAARDQAMRQAQARQQLLANQTARGIENYYQAILSDMDLMPREQDAFNALIPMLKMMPFEPRERTRGPAPGPGGLRTRPTSGPRPPPRSRQPDSTRGMALSVLLERQLKERVSHLFVVEKETLTARDVVVQPDPGAGPTPDQVVQRYGGWLQSVDAQSVSHFETFREMPGGGLNLVCLPIVKNTAVVVAAVPVAHINDTFLSPINAPSTEHGTGAYLIDERRVVMAASRPGLVGGDLTKLDDPQVKAAIAFYSDRGNRGGRVIPEPFALGPEKFAPALLAAEPMEVVPGRQWFVLVASPLAEVDDVVAALFRRVWTGGAIFTALVTAILVSTALLMIRSRTKLERARHEVVRKELERARQIQQAWLPREKPSSRELDVAAVNYPANHISGDFYNWFDLPGGRIAVVIGDVTGHGMSAAFLMATTQLLVRSVMVSGRVSDPGECLTEVNRQLCLQVFSGQFVTMELLLLDPAAGQVHVATAGHPPPLLSNGDGMHPLPLEPQLVMGVDTDVAYETVTIDLSPGATLLLYTDGAPDVLSSDGRRLGDEGMRRVLPELLTRRGDARSVVEAVLGAVNNFRAGRELEDDLTLVAIRLQPAPAALRPEPVGAGS